MKGNIYKLEDRFIKVLALSRNKATGVRVHFTEKKENSSKVKALPLKQFCEMTKDYTWLDYYSNS